MSHVIDTLHNDHEKVSQLLEKLKATTDGSEKTRSSLCQQIKHELLAHTEFEEKVFYPVVRKRNAEARKEVESALNEHEEVDQMLEDIEGMDPTSEQFMATVSQLQEAILDHVRHEEEKIFPLARDTIDSDDAEEMTQRHDQMVEKHMQEAQM